MRLPLLNHPDLGLPVQGGPGRVDDGLAQAPRRGGRLDGALHGDLKAMVLARSIAAHQGPHLAADLAVGDLDPLAVGQLDFHRQVPDGPNGALHLATAQALPQFVRVLHLEDDPCHPVAGGKPGQQEGGYGQYHEQGRAVVEASLQHRAQGPHDVEQAGGRFEQRQRPPQRPPEAPMPRQSIEAHVQQAKDGQHEYADRHDPQEGQLREMEIHHPDHSIPPLSSC